MLILTLVREIFIHTCTGPVCIDDNSVGTAECKFWISVKGFASFTLGLFLLISWTSWFERQVSAKEGGKNRTAFPLNYFEIKGLSRRDMGKGLTGLY